MKKLITFSLIVLLTAPVMVGCKSGTSCFSRNGSRVPTSLLSSSAAEDSALASSATGSRVVNAFPTSEVVMMNANSAYSQCEPCAPSSCNPCDPCSPTRGSSSGYPSAAGSYNSL
ncbi:MAG: hypothetical protein Q4G03_09845 [Planctomycetia bacterium]|nr:hypothetical protein [Planctomycetia bacterium]